MIYNRIKAIPKKINTMLDLMYGEPSIVMNWATEGLVKKNWGDKLNVWMAEKITGLNVIHRSDIYPIFNHPIHYWIGSHLGTACTDKRAVVWGAGCISETVPLVRQPREIHAVRGWLSNERLRNAGITPPDIVGDIALLLPKLFVPQKKYEQRLLGIIPHCYEWNEPFYRGTHIWENVRVIDITGGIEDVIEQIVSCDRIVSSSLHGIICADAYGIPSYWLHASDKPAGDGFKFRDYFSSVGRPDKKPIIVTEKTSKSFIEDQFHDYKIIFDYDKLWNSCPIKNSR